MSDKPQGFFSRWQQRREQVAEEAQETQAETFSEDLASDSTAAEATLDTALQTDTTVALQHSDETVCEPDVLTAADLPDPDSIEVGGSFAAFMAQNVDPLAKKAALRALWKQPHFNEIDGLLEYALDYSNQPKLTAEVSAELVKKVFNKVFDDTSEDEDKQPADMADMPEATEPLLVQDRIEPETNPPTDKLSVEEIDIAQNVPSAAQEIDVDVVKGKFS
ncbi:hypothetical protein NFHSH190041_00420 [Shewanella sp. NFH-SH190041]|uniref:DUF3306 domain-containing protein n=1 Tax=Shewanella sp. NFH-SH190041 TaxID=2950245 RepID=UPI0021C356E7|nr:DUF3306 domain-containing protein [Shewanella sp. NFH-SH190041]BDM62590.1 hypothetical protein NFHSH190041_00420 [Shewanella sp. NFH-SH190041]